MMNSLLLSDYRPDKDLWQLAGAFCDGTLTEPNRDRLERWLSSNPEAKRFFAAYLDLHAQVMWRFREGVEVVEGGDFNLQDFEFANDDSAHETVARGSAESRVPSLEHSPRSLIFGTLGKFSRQTMSSTWAAMIAVGIAYYSVAVLVFWDVGVPAARGPMHGTDIEQSSVARIESSPDCHWKIKPTGDGNEIRPNQPFQIASGSAQVKFGSGATVVIKGPAEFEVCSSNRGFLRVGKLAAHVPHGAVGFEVETPNARIVDLGTDFRLEVNPKETRLAVIAGKVDLLPVNASAKGNKRIAGPGHRVAAGEAVAITGASQGTVAVRQTAFDAKWLAAITPPSSREQLLPPRVVAYQTTENTSGNRRDFHGGVGLDFEVREPIRVFSLGVFDHLGDGIDPATSPVVQLWSRNPQHIASTPEICDDVGRTMLASTEFKADDPGELKHGHRFKSLEKPIDLPVGSYSIIAYGLADANPFITFEQKYDVNFNRDPNWTGSNHTTSGNYYGWSSTTNEAGDNAGEIGGTFARAHLDSFYGDTHLSSTFDLNKKTAASGKFNIGNISREWAESLGRSGFFIGHFSTSTDSPGFLGFLGLEFENIGDAVGTGLVRVRARIQLSLDSQGAVSNATTVSASGNHSFRYLYDPHLGENGRLTVIVDGQPALIADLTDGERNHGAQFDAFGMGATSLLNSDSDPTKTVQVYLDDVSYSGGQVGISEKSTVVDIDESVSRLRVETSRGLIIPMGSRWGDVEPGTFPKMFGKRLIGCAAGSFEYERVEGSRGREVGRGQ